MIGNVAVAHPPLEGEVGGEWVATQAMILGFPHGDDVNYAAEQATRKGSRSTGPSCWEQEAVIGRSASHRGDSAGFCIKDVP